MASSRRRPSGFTQAFTLIELLVVIAIIAILTAILLPVFASVREGSRQGVAVSNMKDIQQKMEQFKLDNHKYPDVLFGYAIPGGYTDNTTNIGNALAKAQAYDTKNGTRQAQLAFPGLYPAYIKDPEVFTDPNSSTTNGSANQLVSDAAGKAVPLATYIVTPCSAANDNVLRGDTASLCNTPQYESGSTPLTQRYFYARDAYDSSPIVTGGNQIGTTFLARYQTVREGTACNGGKPLGCDSSIDLSDAQTATDYRRQLRWQNPPADTIVTLTPYHTQNADKVLVMFASGTVKKVKAEDFLNPKPDTAANFWKIAP
jgi:prepilin-type N-terminal cleavage/methylation domain-containing protein